MTEQVVHLKLAEKKKREVPSHKEQVLAAFDAHVARLRGWLEEGHHNGFALFGYDKVIDDGRPTIQTLVNYFSADPEDCFWMPDMARTRLHQRAHDDEE